jgi:hypothetical protein
MIYILILKSKKILENKLFFIIIFLIQIFLLF